MKGGDVVTGVFKEIQQYHRIDTSAGCYEERLLPCTQVVLFDELYETFLHSAKIVVGWTLLVAGLHFSNNKRQTQTSINQQLFT